MTAKGKNVVGKITGIGALILTSAAVIGLAWSNFAEPRIDKKIEVRIGPIQDYQMRQYFMTKQTLTDSQRVRAEMEYGEYLRAAKGR